VCVLGAVPFGYRILGGLNTFDTIVESEVFFFVLPVTSQRFFVYIAL
jgi:hypothetical protein